MRSTTSNRRAGLEDDPEPKPKQTALSPRVIGSSDFVVTPATTPSALGSRGNEGRYLSRPSLPPGGHREEDGGRRENSGPGIKGSTDGRSEKGTDLSWERIAKKWI